MSSLLLTSSSLFASSALATFAATLAVALIAFVFFGCALAIPALRGRSVNRKCACKSAQDAMRVVKEREHAKLHAMRYSPETVDTTNLPTASPELAEWARYSARLESAERKEESSAPKEGRA